MNPIGTNSKRTPPKGFGFTPVSAPVRPNSFLGFSATWTRQGQKKLPYIRAFQKFQ